METDYNKEWFIVLNIYRYSHFTMSFRSDPLVNSKNIDYNLKRKQQHFEEDGIRKKRSFSCKEVCLCWRT